MREGPPAESPQVAPSPADAEPADAGEPRAEPRPRAGRLRRWLFRVAAMTVVPAAFFGLLELGLRLFGYGFEPAFFVPAAGADALTTNQKFAWRFFPPTGSRPPVPDLFARAKPAGTWRVFVFGGSAAMGSPEPAFSFARILEAMLRERYPAARFEVVNAAMEAMNSHVARAIAREAAECQGDLFVVYLGNNEVVGPYGISDTFTDFTPSLATIRASMWVKTTRTGQLVHDAIGAVALGGQVQVWKGMETFVGNTVPAGDPRLAQTYENFRRNLADVFAAGRACGAKVVCCTVASNLRDCAPFHSAHRPGLAAADLARWRRLRDEGAALQQAGDRAAAVAKYLAAAEIDDRHAGLHYRLGRALLGLANAKEARGHFVRARDLDALRFRADSQVNRVIREAAGRAGQGGVRLVDAERAFEVSPLSPGGLVGAELFHEHVHMTFEGNYTLAAAVFPAVVRLLPASITGGAADEGTQPPSLERCAERLAFTGWERYRLAVAMLRITRRPPFTFQLDHARHHARRLAEIEQLRKFTLPRAGEQTFAAYRKALARDADDLLLRSNYAQCLYGFGRHEAAAEQYRILLEKLPHNAQLHKNFGLGLIQAGRYDLAVEQLTKALEILPPDLDARSNLGVARLLKGELDAAMVHFRRVVSAHGDHADAQTNLGIVLARKGDEAEAVARFERALAADGEHVGALRNYARLLARQGKVAEAMARYRKAIATAEDHRLHMDFAALLDEQGRRDEAMAHYLRAVELAPSSAGAHLLLGKALLARGEYQQAAAVLGTARQCNADLAEAHALLGAAEQRLGLLDRAIGHYAKALRLGGDNPDTRERLAYALLVQNKLPEAIVEFRRVIAADASRDAAHNNLAAALARAGQIDEAIVHFAEAVRIRPSHLRHYNLGTLLLRRGRDREAVVHFQRALALKPGWPDAMEWLAWTLATADEARLRNGAEAVRLARRACELTGWKRAGALDALAAAEAEVGQFAAATATAERARRAALAAGKRSLAARIARRIDLYKARKPCRRGAREVK